MNIHKINLNDYEMYTREEIEQQVTDCEKAQQKLRKKKWGYTPEDKAFHSLAQEIQNYHNEELKLQSVLELIDLTGRGY